jgi:large subunit ribosomal protein L25
LRIIRRKSGSSFLSRSYFQKTWFTLQTHTVEIDLGKGKSFNAILQDIQVHPVSDKILHIDFFQIFDDKEITMEVPVKIIGNSELWQVEIYV